MSLVSFAKTVELSELVNVLSELRLEVCSLVGVDDVTLSELIQHLSSLREHSSSFCFVGSLAEIANEVTHGLSVVAVQKVALLSLADSLQGGLMVCHLACFVLKFYKIGHSRYPVN